MILEVAILDVKSGLELEFEAAFEKAQCIISSMKGYISHQLQKRKYRTAIKFSRPNRFLDYLFFN